MPAATSNQHSLHRVLHLLLLLLCAIVVSGCANMPRIDPSGERLFVPSGASPSVASPGAVGPIGQWGVSVSPSQVIAPVGSEVVMIASFCGPEGYMITNQRVEWMLSPEGVGYFMSPGERRFYEIVQFMRRVPKKVDNQYVVNTTLVVPHTLDRGTPTPVDDVVIQDGQSWVSVSSATEGTSHVTVMIPSVYGWDRRQQTATIYWVDAQWRFPAPAIAAAGGRNTLVTQVTRQSDGSPLAGWLVRYQITSGPAAGLAPNGLAQPDLAQAEVVTNDAGEAAVEIAQNSAAPGTNQIQIQVIRPAGVGGQTRELPLGAGSTLQTWASDAPSVQPGIAPTPQPGIAPTPQPVASSLRVSGPAQGSVGGLVTYRIQLSSPAPSGGVIAVQPPRGLEFANSNPATESTFAGQQWKVADLLSRGLSAVEANYRIVEPGDHQLCASLDDGRGGTARDCVTTRAAAAQLEVTVFGPGSAFLGSEVRFDIQVTNRSNVPANDLVIKNRFDAGLEHAVASNSIERELGSLLPGQTKPLSVTFRAAQPGELCQEITVTAAGGVETSTRKCLTATGNPSGGGVQPAAPSSGTLGAPSSAATASGPSALLSMRLVGEPKRNVGDTVSFVTEVTNNGSTPLANLVIAHDFEEGLEAKGATPGAVWRGNALTWKVETLAPGASVKREIAFKCLLEKAKVCNRVTVSADGVSQLTEEDCVEIASAARPAAEAAPAGRPSVAISLRGDASQIRVGESTVYQLVIENDSQASLYDVVLGVRFSEQLALVRSEGPLTGTIQPNEIRYLPLRELRAGETVSFDLRMRATRLGKATVRAEVASRGMAAESAEETTEVVP